MENCETEHQKFASFDFYSTTFGERVLPVVVNAIYNEKVVPFGVKLFMIGSHVKC